MKREELTKTFMIITNWKKTLISTFYKQIFLHCRLKGLSIVRTAAGALIQTSRRTAPNKLCFLSPQQYPCGGGGGGAREGWISMPCDPGTVTYVSCLPVVRNWLIPEKQSEPWCKRVNGSLFLGRVCHRVTHTTLGSTPRRTHTHVYTHHTPTCRPTRHKRPSTWLNKITGTVWDVCWDTGRFADVGSILDTVCGTGYIS